ncbi:MAG: sigma-70 family RNA polymerase sigma factor [Armatimonadetes bacterium]|nr:sigma-70 family RNA polymerase sigma factor [Armatimonadota bacterium]
MSAAFETTKAVSQDQFADLMKGSYKKVYNLAYRLSGNRADAEDLTQEAYFRAYRRFDTFEGDRPFENWILRIVTRLFLDLARSRRRRVSTVSLDAPIRPDSAEDEMHVQTADDRPNPEEAILNGAVGEDLADALRSLKAEQRALVILADVEQLPYQEIANLAGIPVGTVRSRLHRVHKKLRALLEAKQNERKRCKGSQCLCMACG